ncbi:MAG TPA: DUF5110 domain-containing protein, partial [Polyangia bacterium]|nr:DUF5110 domain-containing protein [Polyangia bacterium]
YFWDDKKVTGNTTTSVAAATGVVPVFVREGAIIPTAPFAKSTFFIAADNLVVHAYTGADGVFQLYEDDGVSEKFRTKNELRVTELRYTQQDLGVQVGAAQGTYAAAPSSRVYQVVYHGLTAAASLYINGTAIAPYASQASIPAGKDGAVWDATNKLLNVYVASRSVSGTFKISTSSVSTGTGGNGGSGGTGGSSGGAGGRGGAAGGGGASTGGAGGSSTGGSGGGGGAAAGGGGGGGGSTGGVSGGTGAGGASAGAGGTVGSGGTASGMGGSSNGGSGAGGSSGATGGNPTGGAGGGPGSSGGGSGCSCETATAVRSGEILQLFGMLAVAAIVLSSRRRRTRRAGVR